MPVGVVPPPPPLPPHATSSASPANANKVASAGAIRFQRIAALAAPPLEIDTSIIPDSIASSISATLAMDAPAVALPPLPLRRPFPEPPACETHAVTGCAIAAVRAVVVTTSAVPLIVQEPAGIAQLAV